MHDQRSDLQETAATEITNMITEMHNEKEGLQKTATKVTAMETAATEVTDSNWLKITFQ